MESFYLHHPSTPVEPISTAVSETRMLILRPVDILLMAAAAILLTLPVLLYGPMVGGHDTYEHLNFTEHFTEQFWSGDLYPRWLLKMNHGLGSPSFFVYPPLPAFIDALFQPAAKVLHFSAFRLMEYLAMFCSGLSALVWAGSLAPRRIALAVSIIYMLIPYHLIADFYRRTALPECWALVWIPLVLFFTARLLNQEKGALAGLAIAYALMIVSHLISVLMLSPIPLAAAMVFSESREKFRNTLRVAAGMLLGAGLASFYLVPALVHSRNFPTAKMISVYPYFLSDNFIEFGKRLYSGGGEFTRTVSLILINTLVLLIICAAVGLRSEQGRPRKNIFFWLGAAVPAVFMMTSWSLPVWKAFPILHDLIQFPWRLNVVLCVVLVPILTAFFTKLFQPAGMSRLTRILSGAAVSLILASWILSYGMVWRRYRTETHPPSTSVSDDDGWFNSWSVPGMNEASAMQASAGPPVRFLTGCGTAAVLLWKPRHVELQTNSTTGGLVMVNQFYYPAWRATLVGGAPAHITPAMPQGLLEVQVAPGHQLIRLDIPVGAEELAGRAISTISALSCALLIWDAKGRRARWYALRHPVPASA
jgi:hypothetical protein